MPNPSVLHVEIVMKAILLSNPRKLSVPFYELYTISLSFANSMQKKSITLRIKL